MGWKAVKEHYRIEHIVRVTEAGICIGSGYMPELIVIGRDGALKKRYADDLGANEKLVRYQSEMDADPAKLKALVLAEDVFTVNQVVYTYEGSQIRECHCEVLGWPNVTHDGEIMYENMFSADKAEVVRWAKESSAGGMRAAEHYLARLQADLLTAQAERQRCQQNLAQLDADYPNITLAPAASPRPAP